MTQKEVNGRVRWEGATKEARKKKSDSYEKEVKEEKSFWIVDFGGIRFFLFREFHV